jgi:hypothetical protein
VLETTLHWPGPIAERRRTLSPKEVKGRFKPVRCYHGRTKFQIDADGRVVECWATDWPDAPRIQDQGIAVAIGRVRDQKKCYHCALLANNEHNAMMNMAVRSLWGLIRIQIEDSLKFLEFGKSKRNDS